MVTKEPHDSTGTSDEDDQQGHRKGVFVDAANSKTTLQSKELLNKIIFRNLAPYLATNPEQTKKHVP